MNDTSPNGKSKREFYLNGTDAGEELGITRYKLTKVSEAVGVGTCRKGRGCRYTATDIRRLRGVVGLMQKYPISAAAAAKIHAEFEVTKAAQAEGVDISSAACTVAQRAAR